MTPTELIEAAAKALFANDEKHKGQRWEFASDRLKNMFRSDARAAASVIIEACANEADEIAARRLSAAEKSERVSVLMYGHVGGAQMVADGIRALAAAVKEGQ